MVGRPRLRERTVQLDEAIDYVPGGVPQALAEQDDASMRRSGDHPLGVKPMEIMHIMRNEHVADSCRFDEVGLVGRARGAGFGGGDNDEHCAPQH